MILLREGNAAATALTTALGTVASDAMSAIGSIIPVAAPIMGAVLIVGIGIKVFKKLRG